MAELDGQRDKDWDAVALAIQNRLSETRTTQMDVASRARVSLTTLRELQHNLNPRRRRPPTLSAISEALGWPAGYLAQVLHGDAAEPHADEATDPVLTTLSSMEQEIRALGPGSTRSSVSYLTKTHSAQRGHSLVELVQLAAEAARGRQSLGSGLSLALGHPVAPSRIGRAAVARDLCSNTSL